MSVDTFLKIEGVKGESKDGTHADEIDVLSWSWGATNSGDMHSGTGGGAGKVQVQDISLTKYVEKSTPTLLQYCCNGKTFPEAILTVRKSGGDKPVEYLVIKFVDVLITNVSTGGNNGDDVLTENLSLSFAKFNMIYTPQKQDGTADAAVEAGWDVLENVAFA